MKKKKIEYKYASLLQTGMFIGYALLIGTFLVYVIGLTPSLISLEDLPNHWSKPAEELLKKEGIKEGWDWINFLHYSDMISLSSLVFFSALVGFCYISLIYFYFKERNYIYSILVTVQIMILALAASGVFSIGH